jgi:hypothetical protein
MVNLKDLFRLVREGGRQKRNEEGKLKKVAKTSQVVNDPKKRLSVFDLPDMDIKKAWDLVYQILYATPEFDEEKENALAEVDKFMRWFLFDYNNYFNYEEFKKRRRAENMQT